MSGLSRHGLAGDVRGFYDRLGIALPLRAQVEVAVRCFADPASHRREDRAASCSINLRSGAYFCHGCGARGGAYDAALRCGLTARAAIDLMVDHGLTARRRGSRPRLTPAPDSAQGARGSQPTRPKPDPPRLDVSERQLRDYRDRLAREPHLLAELARRRAWAASTLFAHDIGWDGSRIVIPVRQAGELCAVYRYAPPGRRRGPKMMALAGSRHALFPDPALLHADGEVWLVEGLPDALAALSAGLPAVAVPGTQAWRPDWASLLVDRDVAVCMDCDAPGRAAAARIADDMTPVAKSVHVLDLAPDRMDGFDLSDAILASNKQRNRGTSAAGPTSWWASAFDRRSTPGPDNAL